MKKEIGDVQSLSDGDLNDYILYGVQQQQLVTPHSDDYQHWLNVVASAKEEKSRRGALNAPGADGKFAKLAENQADDKVEDRNAPGQLHLADNGNPGDGVGVGKDGLPGVEGGIAKDTPERTEG